MFSIRKGFAAATIATLMSAGTALAAQPATTGATGQQPVAMSTTSAPAQFTAISATCAPSTSQPPMSAQGPQSASHTNTPPTFTPWLNINNGQ